MREKVTGWADFVRGNPELHSRLLAWKLSRFKSVGWGGASAKWGGTGNLNIPLSDEQVPLGCVTMLDAETIAGVGFIIDNDLPNYPVDGPLEEPFSPGDFAGGEIANPWLAGLLVDEPFRSRSANPEQSDNLNLQLGRKQEQWLVRQAKKIADAGKWPYPRRRLWLFTERVPLEFLPEMYARWGWESHRQFEYEGLQRWVMYKEF